MASRCPLDADDRPDQVIAVLVLVPAPIHRDTEQLAGRGRSAAPAGVRSEEHLAQTWQRRIAASPSTTLPSTAVTVIAGPIGRSPAQTTPARGAGRRACRRHPGRRCARRGTAASSSATGHRRPARQPADQASAGQRPADALDVAHGREGLGIGEQQRSRPVFGAPASRSRSCHRWYGSPRGGTSGWRARQPGRPALTAGSPSRPGRRRTHPRRSSRGRGPRRCARRAGPRGRLVGELGAGRRPPPGRGGEKGPRSLDRRGAHRDGDVRGRRRTALREARTESPGAGRRVGTRVHGGSSTSPGAAVPSSWPAKRR